MAEVIEVRFGSPSGVIESNPHERSNSVTIAQCLHSRVPYNNRMQNRLVPVRVLVPHRREYLVQVVNVSVPDERSQDSISMILLETVLNVVLVEVEIRLRARYTEDQRYFDERVAGPFHV